MTGTPRHAGTPSTCPACAEIWRDAQSRGEGIRIRGLVSGEVLELENESIDSSPITKRDRIVIASLVLVLVFAFAIAVGDAAGFF